MKSLSKIGILAIAIGATAISCTKNNTDINGIANTAIAASNTLTLNNRVLAAFVIDSSSIYNLSTALPTGYNKFRKQLTYDTVATANKPIVYNVGDQLTLLAYVKGDDYAIGQRSINFKFFQPPTTFIKPTNLYPIQAAEDSIRNFAPKSTDVLDQVSLSTISSTTTPPFIIKLIGTEAINGINYSTYLVQYNYTIPISLSGKLISINFTVNPALRNDLGNVNWNYAFRVK